MYVATSFDKLLWAALFHLLVYLFVCLLISKVHLLYEPGYIITYIGILMEEKSSVSMFDFPASI
jgi:hypothetical protein